VVPVDEDNCQRMLRIRKNRDNTISQEKFDQFSFVPMLEGKNN